MPCSCLAKLFDRENVWVSVEGSFETAVALQQRGRLAEAAEIYAAILDRQPDHDAALLNLAASVLARGRFAEAETLYARADARRPENPDILVNLGLCQAMQDRLGAAEDNFRRVLDRDAGRTDALNNLGGVLVRGERFADAVAIYRRLVDKTPDNADAHDNLGAALQGLGQFDDAAASHRAALKLDPSRPMSHCHLGNALRGAERVAEALAEYARAQRLRPGWPLAEWHRALALLSEGDFAAGWPAYGSRFAAGMASCPELPVARWSGEPLDGRTLLVFGEQGIGDEVMFASCLPDILARAGHSVVACAARLAPVFARSFPAAAVHPMGADGAIPDAAYDGVDLCCPAGDLARHCRPDIASFPDRPAWLVPDSARSERWGERLAALGRGVRVGISWRGGRPGVEHARRSTDLEAWRALAQVPGVSLINLQYGECGDEIARAERCFGLGIHHWPALDPLTDLEGFFGLLANLDLVISIDNATLHMAGAIGCPVWALLPVPPDWRWMRRRQDSPWYPSATLYRQQTAADWASQFERVARDLSELAGSCEDHGTGASRLAKR